MIQWLKEFLFDKTAFVGLIRALLLAFGLAWDKGAFSGTIDPAYNWIGIVLAGLAVFIRAGEPNYPNQGVASGTGKS